MTAVGFYTFPSLSIFNKTRITGSAYIRDLPRHKVLFVCNHETIFMDAIVVNHVISSARWFTNSIRNPGYLPFLRTRTYYVAAKETMMDTWLYRFFISGGGIPISRTWREGQQNIQRTVDLSDQEKIGIALQEGWVITFPQGTTKPFAPGRKGTGHMIKKYQPVVVPVVIDGLRDTFHKRGLKR